VKAERNAPSNKKDTILVFNYQFNYVTLSFVLG